MKKIGVLSIQGDILKHCESIEKLGHQAVKVRYQKELDSISGLIIPGGESTTIGKLLDRFNLMEPLKAKIRSGMPVFGTCAGLILLAKRLEKYVQPGLDALDITVARNAYGRQIESFETDLHIPVLGEEPVRAVFIRAPIITAMAPEVETLALQEEHPVLIRQGNILGCSFHPELTGDTRIHEYFIKMVER